ncbi:hypothetical protein IDH44_17765, partial [Paenibacillus sp. IB182496]
MQKFMKNSGSYILIFVLLITAFPLSPTSQAIAANITETIPVSFGDLEDKLYRSSGAMYGPNETMQSSTISLDAGEGKVIEKLAWYIGSEEMIEVTAAIGKQTWSGRSKITGTPLDVKSEDNNGGFGGWYTWDRYGLGSKGDGRRWYSSVQPNGCAEGPSDPDKDNVPMWPGCSYDELISVLTRNKPYKLDGADTAMTIPSYAVSKNELQAENVFADFETEVEMTELEKKGYTDNSTRYHDFEVVDTDTIHIYYGQDFINDEYNQPWSNPWAQMNIYFAKFKADFVSKTYQFPGTLKVTYGPAGGKLITRHYTTTGQSLAAVFPDDVRDMEVGQSYSTTPPSNPTYTYEGYKKTTTGTPPSGGAIQTSDPPTFTYDGSYGIYYLYLYYKPVVPESSGELNIRHMVRTGSSGPFTLADEEFQIVPLPYSQTLNGKAAYGDLIGSNVYYTGYGSAYTGHDSVPVSMTTSQKKAYVSFYYEASDNEPGTFSGDFEVVPGTIDYQDPFALVPKDFEMNGCTYQSHRYRIVHVASGTTSTINATGMTTSSSFVYDTYPSAIKTGSHQVFLKIFTDCGESEWIGPKPLEVEVAADNRPPVFQIAFVDPQHPTVPVYSAQEGTRLNLVVIEDPSVPTPYDPEGHKTIFRGFDFTESTDWAKTIPQQGYSDILMSQFGMHANIKGTMCDELGACAEATTYIRVIPPNPVPVIDGPERVVEGRPYEGEFDSSRSYSPVGRSINHSRDEWTNVREIYPNPGQEIITLHVYDSIGLKSVEPDEYELTVLEDLPPEVELIGSRTAVRNTPFTYSVEASSPDGDEIVSRTVKRRYDAANDGSFTNDSPLSISVNGLYKFTETFTRVGKYQYEVCAEEDWGKRACTVEIVDVVNDAPFVTFDIQSTVQEPVAIPKISISNEKFLLSTWKNTDIASESRRKDWMINPATGYLGHVPTEGEIYLSPAVLPPFSSTRTISLPLTYWDTSTFREYTYEHHYLNEDWMLSNAKNDNSDHFVVAFSSSGTKQGNGREDRVIFKIDRIHEIVVLAHPYSDQYEWYTFDSIVNPSGTPFHRSTLPPPIQIGQGKTARTGNITHAGYQDFVVAHIPDVNQHTSSDNRYTISGYTWQNDETPVSSWSSDDEEDNDLRITRMLREGKKFENDAKGKWYIYGFDYGQWPKRAALNQFNPFTKQFSLIRLDDHVKNADDAAEDIFVSPDGKTGILHEYDYGGEVIDMRNGERIQRLSELGVGYSKSSKKLSADYVFIQTDNLLKWGNGEVTRTSLPGATELTNDQYMYQWGANQTLQAVELATGNTINIGSYAGSTRSEALLDDGSLVVRENTDSTSRLYVYKSAPKESSTVPLLTQQQLRGGPSLDNIELRFRMRLNQVGSSKLYSGFSYKMQDNRNMYRVEMNRDTLRLVKVSNGKRTVLKSIALATPASTFADIRIHVLDDRHRVYVNGAPLIDITDSTFSGGKFGPYSEIQRTEFDRVLYADLAVLSNELRLTNVALVDTDVEYQTTSEDAE